MQAERQQEEIRQAQEAKRKEIERKKKEVEQERLDELRQREDEKRRERERVSRHDRAYVLAHGTAALCSSLGDWWFSSAQCSVSWNFASTCTCSRDFD